MCTQAGSVTTIAGTTSTGSNNSTGTSSTFNVILV